MQAKAIDSIGDWFNAKWEKTKYNVTHLTPYKIIRSVDNGINYLLLLALLLLLFTGVYFMLDTLYVYHDNDVSRSFSFQSGADAEEIIKEFTDDYVAWLFVDDANINYPVMQGLTNETYLDLDPYGEYSLSGSIFLDWRNKKDFSDTYNMVYGHHMAGGYMFGALDKYYDRTYFNNHKTGTLTVGNTTYDLQAFAVLQVAADVDEIFEPRGYERVLEYARNNALYFEEPGNHHFLALSTCVDSVGLSRTVVLFTMTEGDSTTNPLANIGHSES